MATLPTNTILTRHGHTFDFLNPEASPIDIRDIAHALSQINRFGGHTLFPYSVAQHSVIVSYLVPPEDALYGLLHDGNEAYVGDIPKPLKVLLPDYHEIEERVWESIRKVFNLPETKPASIKPADLAVLALEKRDVMPSHSADWEWCSQNVPKDMTIMPISSYAAYCMFLRRFYTLTNAHEALHELNREAASRLASTRDIALTSANPFYSRTDEVDLKARINGQSLHVDVSDEPPGTKVQLLEELAKRGPISTFNADSLKDLQDSKWLQPTLAENMLPKPPLPKRVERYQELCDLLGSFTGINVTHEAWLSATKGVPELFKQLKKLSDGHYLSELNAVTDDALIIDPAIRSLKVNYATQNDIPMVIISNRYGQATLHPVPGNDDWLLDISADFITPGKTVTKKSYSATSLYEPWRWLAEMREFVMHADIQFTPREMYMVRNGQFIDLLRAFAVDDVITYKEQGGDKKFFLTLTSLTNQALQLPPSAGTGLITRYDIEHSDVVANMITIEVASRYVDGKISFRAVNTDDNAREPWKLNISFELYIRAEGMNEPATYKYDSTCDAQKFYYRHESIREILRLLTTTD